MKKFLYSIAVFVIFQSTMHGWFGSTLFHKAEHAAHSAEQKVKSAASKAGHAVQGLYDDVTLMDVAYSKKSGYPLGIENFTLQLNFAGNINVDIPIIQNGNWVTYGSEGSTQALLSGLVSGSESSLLNVLTSSSFTSSDSELQFTMAYSGKELHLTTAEKTTTSTQTDGDKYHSSDYNTSSQTRNIGAIGMNLGSAVIKKMNPKLTAAPTSAPQSYHVTINGSVHNTKFSRGFYIDL